MKPVYEKKVPLPALAKPRIDLSDWKIGDSFVVVDERARESVRDRARRLGFSIATRKTEPVGYRCWRVK